MIAPIGKLSCICEQKHTEETFIWLTSQPLWKKKRESELQFGVKIILEGQNYLSYKPKVKILKDSGITKTFYKSLFRSIWFQKCELHTHTSNIKHQRRNQ